MTSRLDGKVALVTGAQQGIGRAIAVAMAAAGADVAINYLDGPQAAEGVAAEVRDQGRRVALVQGSVATPAGCAAIVEGAVAAFGGIDILVNNAGMFPRVGFLEMTEKDYDFVMDINLKGTFFCSQAAAKAMIKAGRKGAIISLASQAITGRSPNGSHYAATKGGIVSLTRAMSLELIPHGIRVNAVAPGLTDTAQPRYGNTDAELAQMALSNIPLQRMGRPEEIANVAVFLASEQSSFMIGQTVHANGGTYMPS